MKELNFRRIWFIPVLLMVFLLVSLNSCEKDEETPSSDSLAVTVNFTGNTVPEVGDILSVVVFNTDVTQLDLQQEVEPDVNVAILLTQDMIDNGITVHLDTINLNAPLMYIGAFVDLDDDFSPSTGDLIEFYQDVSMIDAVINGVHPVNAHGLSSLIINLDDVMTFPTLEVTVNFTGDMPTADDVLHVALFYYSLAGVAYEMIDPDDDVFRNLTPNDIGAGSVTLTFHNVLPWEDEVYVGAFVDTNGDQLPGLGELIEMYQDKDIMAVLAGMVAADNVFGETAITINLDQFVTL